MLPALPDDKLEAVRLLAREGCREATIRRALGLTATQWKALRDEDSELAVALDEGRAGMADELIAIMLERARGKDMTAVRWLLENVCHVSKPKDADTTTPRVVINLGAGPAPDMDTYLATRVIEHDN